jgi:hypothetical protein
VTPIVAKRQVYVPKPKRQLTKAQKAALKKGRQALKEWKRKQKEDNSN